MPAGSAAAPPLTAATTLLPVALLSVLMLLSVMKLAEQSFSPFLYFSSDRRFLPCRTLYQAARFALPVAFLGMVLRELCVLTQGQIVVDRPTGPCPAV